MTKRNSPYPTIKDVDMSAADSAVKKAKVDQVEVEVGFENYPQDQYVLSETLKQSRFDVFYMATRARAEVIRLMFEFCGANYTSSAPVAWPKGKKDTPFGLLPLITHYKPDGSVFRLSQVGAIQRYAGRLLGLVGSNEEENAIVDSCNQCALEDILNVMQMNIWLKPKSTDEDTEKAFKAMTPFLDGIEQYLVKNGSNGYLVGQKTTYAEFPWFDWMSMFYAVYPNQFKPMCNESTRPALFKMYQRLESNPRLQAYIKGGRWEYRPSKPFAALYSTGVCVSDWDKAFEFYSKTLGLECLANRQPEGLPEGARYMEFIANPLEKTKFTVFCYGKGAPADPAAKTSISWLVQDVNDSYERLLKRGVVFKMPPATYPWGTVAAFTDPDGNTLNICDAPKF
ncbi:hypothetical protein EMPS_08413 [Entomortierella parvispora]|uniref:VOC domain-containing protein n=1 Tax=Entomortierella parvispora TaxID=205924 RepID=A0A9P3HFZ1_9FUNG|nr:hypothetical protein EMPS_08413 [Entomortierella parvispora]